MRVQDDLQGHVKLKMHTFVQVCEHALVWPSWERILDVLDVELGVDALRKVERHDDTLGGATQVPDASSRRWHKAVLPRHERLWALRACLEILLGYDHHVRLKQQ